MVVVVTATEGASVALVVALWDHGVAGDGVFGLALAAAAAAAAAAT